MLVNEVSFGHDGPEGVPRMNASSNNQSRGQKRWSAVQWNVLGSFIGMDRYCRNIGQV